MKLKLYIIALLTLTAVSCTKDIILPKPETKGEEIVTINASISPETRVAYNGGTGNNALSWENKDKLLLLGYDANNNYKGKTTFTWTGTGNQFKGQIVSGATTYKAYYPEGANAKEWGVEVKDWEEGYKPNLNPTQQNSITTASDVAKASAKIESGIEDKKKHQDLLDVTCPKCGYKFQVKKFDK
ncbi:MAG TPA: hypothetical protein PK979_02430 [Bacteroidales bacterium]|nr:hypothetical protein [Bacteroidales bacterium]